MALLALLGARDAAPGTLARALLVVGLVGAALLYGDGAITPAISVLSAIEGLKVDAPALDAGRGAAHHRDPDRAVHACSSKGTGVIGRVFGPVMLVWFAVLGRARRPSASPQAPGGARGARARCMRFDFLLHAGLRVSFAMLGAVFLAVTGGEAMYADMGHFGRQPIRLAWFALVLPGAGAELFRPGRRC